MGVVGERENWRTALDEFVERLRSLYGERLKGVILYGSRARGDGAEDSDIDTLVVLEPLGDFWSEFDHISPLAGEVSLDFGVVLSAIPASGEDLREVDSPLFLNVRREGVTVG